MAIGGGLASAALAAYTMLGRAVYPFMGPFLRLRARRGKEDHQRRYERYGYPSADRPSGPLVWFHAASVGEANAVLPLVTHVAGLGIHTVLTTGTVTSAQVVRTRMPKTTFHQYVPLDLDKAVQRFLDHWQPDLAVFTESEIWPATILEMNRRRIPQVLVNARMSDRSHRRWTQARSVARQLFGSFSHVIAQSDLDAERFRELGARPVTVSGNLKVDIAAPPADEGELEGLRAQIGARPAWIAASTHRGEEAIVLEAHRALVARLPDLLTVLVPRHPDRGGEVARLAEAAGFGAARRGSGEVGPISGAIDTDSADAWLTGTQANDAMGVGLGAGDLNMDGVGDLLIGAPGAGAAGQGVGELRLLYGG